MATADEIEISSSSDSDADDVPLEEKLEVMEEAFEEDISVDKRVRYLKETGNYHFGEFKKRVDLMSHERKRTVLNWAIQVWDSALARTVKTFLKKRFRLTSSPLLVCIGKKELNPGMVHDFTLLSNIRSSLFL